MSTLRRRGLQIDDPLGPGRAVQPTVPADEPGAEGPDRARNGRAQGEASDRPSTIGSARKPRQPARSASRSTRVGRRKQHRGRQVAQPGDGLWREWSGITSVGSFRLPHELLAELGDAARELGLPIGMIVTAAITRLLDQPPEEVAALVDRADDARIHGRRIARRRLTSREGRG
jgi:hypothetical protein